MRSTSSCSRAREESCELHLGQDARRGLGDLLPPALGLRRAPLLHREIVEGTERLDVGGIEAVGFQQEAPSLVQLLELQVGVAQRLERARLTRIQRQGPPEQGDGPGAVILSREPQRRDVGQQSVPRRQVHCRGQRSSSSRARARRGLRRGLAQPRQGIRGGQSAGSREALSSAEPIPVAPSADPPPQGVEPTIIGLGLEGAPDQLVSSLLPPFLQQQEDLRREIRPRSVAGSVPRGASEQAPVPVVPGRPRRVFGRRIGLRRALQPLLQLAPQQARELHDANAPPRIQPPALQGWRWLRVEAEVVPQVRSADHQDHDPGAHLVHALEEDPLRDRRVRSRSTGVDDAPPFAARATEQGVELIRVAHAGRRSDAVGEGIAEAEDVGASAARRAPSLVAPAVDPPDGGQEELQHDEGQDEPDHEREEPGLDGPRAAPGSVRRHPHALDETDTGQEPA